MGTVSVRDLLDMAVREEERRGENKKTPQGLLNYEPDAGNGETEWARRRRQDGYFFFFWRCLSEARQPAHHVNET